MKSYEDITERVFRKGDIILEKRRRRTETIKRTSLALSGICAVILVGFGIWKNNDIKNAVNNYYNDCPIITENDDSLSSQTNTEISVQTSVTEKNILSTTNTGSDITENHTTFSQTTTVNASTANNTVQTTTIITQHSSLNKTETQAEPLQETIQTTISSTMQTDLIVTNITTTSQNIDDERSFYMKKLTSFISAITMASAAVPITGNAVYTIDPLRYWPGEKEIFSKMESGELEIDIDGNGEFDIFDCYTLQCYCAQTYDGFNYFDSETMQRIEAIADYGEDGQVGYDDSTTLMRYFMVSNKLKREYFTSTYYDPEFPSEYNEVHNSDYYPNSPAAYSFTNSLNRNSKALRAGYYVLAEMYENGTIDLDFNGNGQLDVGDIFDVFVYDTITGGYDHPMLIKEGYPDIDTAKTLISEEEQKRCEEAFLQCPYPFIHWSGASDDIGNFDYYVTLYIAGHIELKPEYFTEEYYVETIDNYVKAYGLHYRMEDAVVALGLKKDDDAWLKLDQNEFNTVFDAYCNDVENSLRSAPDINMDGVVDYKDYFDSNIYFDDLINSRTAAESILPADVWNNLANNCDFNNNGTSGDIYDITTVQMYVVRFADEIEDFNESYNKYVESLGETPENIPVTVSYEDNVKTFLSLDVKRSGNANNDDDVNIADSVLVMQSIANPDNYKLTTKGKFNADVYNTGDGITCSDALEIQLLATEK
ncbi:MAG: hypothetical protein K2O29_06460 [Ruminococcus sp.]|nr:hypothetical protein [Ruminococcus sp.]